MSSAEMYTNGRGRLIVVCAEGFEVTNALQTCSAVPMQSNPDSQFEDHKPRCTNQVRKGFGMRER